jgi:hypothetical protein
MMDFDRHIRVCDSFKQHAIHPVWLILTGLGHYWKTWHSPFLNHGLFASL